MPIVQAVGVAVKADDPDLAEQIGDAMVRACKEQQALGETDPHIIRDAMLKARDEVLRG